MFIYSLPITPQCHTKRHVQEKRGNFVTARNERLEVRPLNLTSKTTVEFSYLGRHKLNSIRIRLKACKMRRLNRAKESNPAFSQSVRLSLLLLIVFGSS